MNVIAPLAIAAVFFVLYVRDRRTSPRGQAAIFVSLVALYFLTPKTLSGIFLVSVRLPVFAGMISTLLISPGVWNRWLKGALLAVAAAALLQTAVFHQRFSMAIAGLDEMLSQPPPSTHGYVSLVGRQVLGSRHVYLDHLGQWWTAQYGGRGHNFFADADHHPVQFRQGVTVPADLWSFEPELLNQFEALLVFGDAPLPPALAQWEVAAQKGAWRKLRRPGTASRHYSRLARSIPAATASISASNCGRSKDEPLVSQSECAGPSADPGSP